MGVLFGSHFYYFSPHFVSISFLLSFLIREILSQLYKCVFFLLFLDFAQSLFGIVCVTIAVDGLLCRGLLKKSVATVVKKTAESEWFGFGWMPVEVQNGLVCLATDEMSKMTNANVPHTHNSCTIWVWSIVCNANATENTGRSAEMWQCKKTSRTCYRFSQKPNNSPFHTLYNIVQLNKQNKTCCNEFSKSKTKTSATVASYTLVILDGKQQTFTYLQFNNAFDAFRTFFSHFNMRLYS